MIQSTGQILTGKAIANLDEVIVNKADDKGFYKSAYKALVCPEQSAITNDSLVNGTWCQIGSEGADARFLGVVGDDTSPEANINLTSNKPVVEFGASYSVPAGGVVTFERNGMISVIAGGAIKEGDLLELANNGAFKAQATPDASKAVGRAYGNAAANERFVAFIKAL